MKLGTRTLDFSTLKRMLVRMLQMSWGSKHSYTDHHDTTNTCLLCKATALWFSLATQLLIENEKQQQLEEDGGGGDSFISPVEGRPSRSQHQRISMKAIRSKIRRLTHGETNTLDDFNPATASLPVGKFPRKKGALDESRKVASEGSDGKVLQGEDVEFDREFPPAEVKPKPKMLRKMATVPSDMLQAMLPALQEEDGEEDEEEEEEERDEEEEEEDEEEEAIQKVFQLCRDVRVYQPISHVKILVQ